MGQQNESFMVEVQSRHDSLKMTVLPVFIVVYLYAAMGAIMLTGIMAIFEMGLSLTGQTLLSTPSDVYFDLQTPRLRS